MARRPEHLNDRLRKHGILAENEEIGFNSNFYILETEPKFPEGLPTRTEDGTAIEYDTFSCYGNREWQDLQDAGWVEISSRYIVSDNDSNYTVYNARLLITDKVKANRLFYKLQRKIETLSDTDRKSFLEKILSEIDGQEGDR